MSFNPRCCITKTRSPSLCLCKAILERKIVVLWPNMNFYDIVILTNARWRINPRWWPKNFEICINLSILDQYNAYLVKMFSKFIIISQNTSKDYNLFFGNFDKFSEKRDLLTTKLIVIVTLTPPRIFF